MFIFVTMKYAIGDILICSKPYQGDTSLIVGDQYQIINLANIHGYDGPKIALNLKHIKTGNFHHFIDDRCFIPLSVYREFQLRKILD